jgi:predicted transcriptional regulator
MVVGEAEVVEVVGGSPDEVWDRTSEHSGISRDFFDEYFSGKEQAIAYSLGTVRRYPKPRGLGDYGLRAAPQSFAYITA